MDYVMNAQTRSERRWGSIQGAVFQLGQTYIDLRQLASTVE